MVVIRACLCFALILSNTVFVEQILCVFLGFGYKMRFEIKNVLTWRAVLFLLAQKLNDI